MSSIQFRGMDDGIGVWRYGCVGRGVSEQLAITPEGNSVGHIILEDTLGQYTGGDDMYERMLYAGDIVLHHDEEGLQHTCVIAWDVESLCWELSNSMNCFDFSEIPANKWVRIGNIYEDSGLIARINKD